MTISIFSSNNEEALLKSVGPYKIPVAGTSIAGVRLPTTTKLATPFTIGTVRVYGSQIKTEKLSVPGQKQVAEEDVTKE